MNEFTAKKIGEVLAFNRVGSDTVARAREVLVSALGEERVLDIEEKDRIHAEEILRIVTEAAVVDITLAKSEKTEEKLKKMRDLYIGDQWDNVTEVFEWSGFFEGAAIVHWALVRGAAQSLNSEPLMLLAEEGVNWHYEQLEMVEGELGMTGQSRAES